MASIAQQFEVGAEATPRRTFAWVIGWPGWCRSGKGEGEGEALAALARYLPRYRAAVAAAGFGPAEGDFPEFKITERLDGSATTDFGAPSAIGQSDLVALSPEDGERLAALVACSWVGFEAAAELAPRTLRKGPRGGGRDRDRIVEHVRGADFVYARKIGLKQRAEVGDLEAVARLRSAATSALRSPRSESPTPGSGWPLPYYARRSAWHALDHLWEIEDRTDP